jgi:hypothetical protein
VTARQARLDKLEHSLTPKEAAILWVEETHAFPTLTAYAASLVGKPNAAFPLFRLPEQVEAAVRKQTKGEKIEEVAAEVRRAVRDVVFLAHLHFDVNTRVTEGHRGNLMHTLFLAERLGRLIRMDPFRGGAGEMREEAVFWRELARPLLAEVYTLVGTVANLEATYFDGHGLLFPTVRENLDSVVSHVEQVVGLYNDVIEVLEYVPIKKKRARADRVESPEHKVPAAEGFRLDLAEVRGSLQPEIEALAALIVALAKAEALEFIGEGERGLALVEKHLTGA